jgi:hypothetical protein
MKIIPTTPIPTDTQHDLLVKILLAILAGGGGGGGGGGGVGATYQGTGNPNGQITPTVNGNRGAIYYQTDSVPPNQLWIWNVTLQTWQ